MNSFFKKKIVEKVVTIEIICTLRLCLFWLKTFSENPFTWNRVFDCAWKIDFSGKSFTLTWKIFSTSVLPSSHFQRRAKRERERERTHRCANREREREREREIAPSSLRSSRLDRRPHPLHVTVRSRHEPTNWSTHLVHRRDHATNPRTDRRPRPLHVTVRSPRTHEPIDPPRPLARSRHEPMNRSTHPSSSPTNPRTDCATIGLVILIFFSFDFCFLCCLYASIICNNICLDPKKMWETW